MDFDVKDSGKRHEFSTGMVRDVEDDKVDYTLVMDGPMFLRWAKHLTKGARKYAKRNWLKAGTDDEAYERFRSSALRHMIQWYYGDRSEDHAAAVIFNVNGAEYVRDNKLLAGNQSTVESVLLKGFLESGTVKMNKTPTPDPS